MFNFIESNRCRKRHVRDLLKGKQVKILYDLVTVSRECKIRRIGRSHWAAGKTVFA